MISNILHLLIIFFALSIPGNGDTDNESVHIRINQVGYLPDEHKSAIVFSHDPVKERFELIEDGSGTVLLTIKPVKTTAEGWGTFKHYYELDFTRVKLQEGFWKEYKCEDQAE